MPGVTRLMVDPAGGKQYKIPFELVEQAKKDGLVSAEEMVDKSGARYAIPVDKRERAQASGLNYENLSPVPSPSTPQELEQADKEYKARHAVTPENVPNLLKDLWTSMNQGGPADWRNILNAIGPILPGIGRPIESMRWSAGGQAPAAAANVGKLKGVKDLSALFPPPGPAIGEITHLGSNPAYIQPLSAAVKGVGKVGAAGVSAAKAVGGVAKAGNAAIDNAIGGRTLVGDLIKVSALNHFLGDPAGLKQLVRSWFERN